MYALTMLQKVDVEGNDKETRKRNYNSVRRFYKSNLIEFLTSPLKIRDVSNSVKVEVNAIDFLQYAIIMYGKD